MERRWVDMSEVSKLIAGLSAEELKELKEALGMKKARVPKEQSPEYLEAKAKVDAIVAENPELFKRYEAAKEGLKGVKGTRVIHATKRYKFDVGTGAITDNDGNHVATFDEKGWQAAMRAAGYTTGQVAAVSKAVRTAEKKLEEVA
jgi:hypothetical protein